jgi:hypothetical protein
MLRGFDETAARDGGAMEQKQLPLLSIMINTILEEGKPQRLELTVFGRLPEVVTSLITDFSTAGFTFEPVTEHEGMLKTTGSMACEDEARLLPQITAWWKQYCQTNNG